jgi:hypothetical protein
MTDFSDLKAQIAEYANRQDWSDVLVTGFIRQAEAKFNEDLRVDRMIQTDSSTILTRCAQLPTDWLAMDFVSIASVHQNNPNGWAPIVYKPRQEFFNLPDNCALGYYTIEGRQIFFGGVPDAIAGIQYQISYYGEVPVFTDINSSWIYTKYPSLYLYGSLMHADLHAVGEEDKAGAMKIFTEDMIGKLNAAHLRSKASGSRLMRSRRRSFG